ncbi:KIF21B [Symbiodinium sp. CCMP2456]|nr:KIF21B [Symbiodinium sp. CCMP2456]
MEQRRLMEKYLLEDFLNGWFTRNEETLPAIRKHKEHAVLNVPAAGVQSVTMCEEHFDFLCHYFATLGAKLPLFSCHKAVLQTLAKRYAIFPAQTRKRILKAWAASEASVMRGMAVHALLLARRSSGSKSAKIRMLKELIASALGASDVDAAIEAEIQASLQDPTLQDGSADSQSSASIDGERMDQDDLLEELKPPASILKAFPGNIDNMETQVTWWDIPPVEGCKAMIVEDKENQQRAPVNPAPANLTLSEDLVKTHDKDLQEARLSEAVAEQLEVQKAARLAAAARKVEAAAKKADPKTVAKGSKVKTGAVKGRGRGRGRGAVSQAEPQQEAAEASAEEEEEEAENAEDIATTPKAEAAPKAKAKAKGKAKAKPAAQAPAENVVESGKKAKPAAQAPAENVVESKAKAKPAAQAPAENVVETDWDTKATELKKAGIPIPDGFDGSHKSYTLAAKTYNPATPDAGSIGVLWTSNTLYVNTVDDTSGFHKNKKGGCNICRSKYENSWKSCWNAARFAAGWTVTWLADCCI